MTKVQKRTFSLSEEQSAYIDDKVAGGGYASSSEVVREGLRILQERDAAIERWIQREVIPTYDRWKAGLEEEHTLEEVFEELHQLIDERAKRRNTTGSEAVE